MSSKRTMLSVLGLCAAVVPAQMSAQTAPPTAAAPSTPPASAATPAPATVPAAPAAAAPAAPAAVPAQAAPAAPASTATSDLDAAVKASKPLLEADDATGHVTSATTTGCSMALTLDSKQSITLKLGGTARADGNSLTLNQPGGSPVTFTFRSDDADVLAKTAEKAFAPVTTGCKK